MTDRKGASAPGFQDPCEWDPRTNEPAEIDGGCENQAVWLVGGNGKWRLCDSCAQLPTFNRLRKRIRIGPTWVAVAWQVCDSCGNQWVCQHSEGVEEIMCPDCGYGQPITCPHTMIVKNRDQALCADCGADINFGNKRESGDG